MITRAARQSDGSWVLNGSKMWITNGSTADVAIIWAKTEGDDPKSIRGFVVDTDTKGFSAKDQKGKLSLRASDTSELVLDEVHVPADALMPGSGGLKSPLMCLTQARYGISWGVLGAAMACFEEAVSYAKNRVMFDRPIGGFQIQQVRLADMLTELVKGQLVSLQDVSTPLAEIEKIPRSATALTAGAPTRWFNVGTDTNQDDVTVGPVPLWELFTMSGVVVVLAACRHHIRSWPACDMGRLVHTQAQHQRPSVPYCLCSCAVTITLPS
jgi:alkylation response protein AidB-like acyl-CoA dehydrogenase